MSNSSDLEKIAFRDLPHHLALEMLKYGVTLLGVDRSVGKVAPEGSGTFVKSSGKHYILTAAHCARDIQPYPELGLAISEKPQGTSHPVPKPIYVAPQRVLGPDLAFLPLTQDIVDYVVQNSNKEFYDLDRHRNDLLEGNPKMDFGLWVIVGPPLFLAGVENGARSVTLMGYSVGVGERFTEEEFDYIEVRVALDGKDVPPSFAGVSGGGLWQVELVRLEDNSITFATEPRLEGCEFSVRKEWDDDKYIYLKCHSRKSIYEIGFNKLQEAAGV